ncbi:MAG: hypothetical protein KUG81_05735 [Gammaproteobacteria bacterium]|nr:hypothetical protein [Gammaproteobacteria bacterium]
MKQKKQSGAVLAVSLMILLMLTVLTVTSNRTVLMQNKMANATFDGQVSLQVAESAVRDAEEAIDALSTISTFDAEGSNGLYSQGNGPSNVFIETVWTGITNGGAPKVITSNAYSIQGNGISAEYFIESLGEMALEDEDLSGVNMLGYGQTTGGGDVNVFRIVSRATGNSGNTERIVEVFYGRRL